MESKKRPHADDVEHSRAKKRAVSDEHSSPSHLNGTPTPSSDEPKEGDNIELFRKEAIFRRMRYYSREAERSQARVAELERRFSTCQAGLAAMEACWTQLIGTIRSLVKPEDLPSLQKESEGIYDLTLHLSSEAEPVYVEALRDKMQTTADIVKAFVNLSSQGHTGPSNEELLHRCQEAETERSALRSELSFVRTKLHDSEAQKEKLHEQWVWSEKRLDRLQSKSLNPTNSVVVEEPAESPPKENGASPPPPPTLNGTHTTQDSDELQDLANLRESKIEELMHENTGLQNQLQAAQLQLKTLPDEWVIESTPYKLLQERTSRSEHNAQEWEKEVGKLKEQLDSLVASRSEFEAGMKTVHDSAINELKQTVNKRDIENGRLREQRDQATAELVERKAKDQLKTNAAQEFKALADAYEERLVILASENQRLKTRLAANAGDEDLVTFLWQGADTTYVDDLKQRLAMAEERVAALDKTLASIEGGHDRAKSEAELHSQLVQVQKELDKYRAVYGDASSVSSETAQLSQQLQSKQDELDRLHLQDKEREQAESAMYTELEKLEDAWQAAEKQLKKKVYDLSGMEERLNKVTVDKAKADNKFYQCVREKDSVEAERKKISLNLEKMSKAIEKLRDTENNLLGRISILEKETALWKKIAEEQKTLHNSLDNEVTEWKLRAQGERKGAEEEKARAALAENTQAIEKRRTELRKLEESLLKSQKDAERQAAKLKSLSTPINPNSKDSKLQVELNKCMALLKCSTCNMEMRNTVITKCMHTFCKSCVDARIATRQRKCPACNLGFSSGEVQTLYLQ